MRLTKEIKNELALDLTKKAIAKAVTPIAKRLKAVNERFWSDHIKDVENVFPVPRKDWAKLIELGLLQATTYRTPYRKVTKNHGDTTVQALAVDIENTEALRKLLHRGSFPSLQGHVRTSSRHIVFSVQASCAVPLLSGMDQLTPGSWIEQELIQVETKLKELVAAAEDFHGKVTDLLSSCSTKAQLLAILPEAEALLPEPEKKSNIVPASLVMSVQGMLSKGVPPSI